MMISCISLNKYLQINIGLFDVTFSTCEMASNMR